jgi:thiamine-phosphate pyrophosphorylase
MAPLYVLTGSEQTRGDHAEIARLAIAGGAGVVQFRDARLHAPGALRAVLEAGRAVAAACREAGVVLVVNDRVDVALALEADGVHLGATDMPLADARRILGTGAIIGASTQSADEARAAERAGASYVSFGPFAPTRSKRGAGTPRSWDELAEVARAVTIPVYAAGGMTPELARAALRHGASGVVVHGAIAAAANPSAAARTFAEHLR